MSEMIQVETKVTPKVKRALVATRDSVHKYFPKVPATINLFNPEGTVTQETTCLSCVGPAGSFNQLDYQLATRPECETDTTLLQLIPYITLVKVDQTTRELSVFQYKRGTQSTEDRLVDKISIGLGGHVEECPGIVQHPGAEDTERTISDILFDTCLRELEEEASLTLDSQQQMMLRQTLVQNVFPIIYNDDDAVGAVHLGISIILDMSTATAVINPDEVEVTESGFVTVKELINNKDIVLEKWSQIVLWKLCEINNSILLQGVEHVQAQYEQIKQQKEEIDAAIALFESENSPINQASKFQENNTLDHNSKSCFDSLTVDFNYTTRVMDVDPLPTEEIESKEDSVE